MRRVKGRVLSGVALALLLLLPASASALSLEPVGDFEAPTFTTSDPSDENRLFVTEKDLGRVRLIEEGIVQGAPYLDIGDLVRGTGERGLLSVAFDPDFEATGRFYVYFTGKPEAGAANGDIHIDEFTASPPDADTVSATTRRRVLTIPRPAPGTANHNGGQLQFGPDDHLYASVGDGGGGGDPWELAQDTSSLHGKLLRIDPEDPDGAGSARYSVPASNPFVGVAGEDEIWSYGLRNPWRFSFDRLDGSLWIGDVGQGLWEEIDHRTQLQGGGRGDNFGWDCREGAHVFEAAGCPPLAEMVDPIHEYDSNNGNCSITGGYVVRDESLGNLAGRYLYSDFCAGQLRSLDPALGTGSDRSEGLSVSLPISFGEDACGRIYVNSNGGDVYRLVGDGEPPQCDPPTPPPPDPYAEACSAPALVGGPGKDRLRGSDTAGDVIRGRAGADKIIGLGRGDCLYGGPGRDRIKPGRGPDVVKCGKGRDVVIKQGRDRIARSCEKVKRA